MKYICEGLTSETREQTLIQVITVLKVFCNVAKGQREDHMITINKSNLTTDVVQVEANVQEQLSDHLHFRKIKFCKNARYFKYFHMFALAFTIFEILKFYILTFKK